MPVDHLQENKQSIQKFKETGDSRYIYENELDKACFQHGMAYGNFKDVTTIIDITFWDFVILYQIPFLPQVRWSMIIINEK